MRFGQPFQPITKENMKEAAPLRLETQIHEAIAENIDLHGVKGPFEQFNYLGELFMGTKGSFASAREIIGEQFLEGAQAYDEAYYQPEAMTTKLLSLLEYFDDLKLPSSPDILDLASGTGNSLAAAARIFPGCRIVATDISPDMIKIISHRFISSRSAETHCHVSPLLANAETIALKKDSFDLIIGSSMLHHLLTPFEAITRYLHGLRPGGIAIFFEPFMAGTHVIRIMMKQLLLLQEHGIVELPTEASKTLALHLLGIETAGSEDRSASVLSKLDDKWIFNKSDYFDIARKTSTHCTILSSNGSTTFKDRLQSLLGGSLIVHDLPKICTSFVDAFDQSMGPKLRQEFLTEGSILFRKLH